MGLFGFNKKEKQNVNWIKLVNSNQLEEIKELSNDKPQLIFKHSTRCSISSMALHRFESDFNLIADKVGAYYLDLIAFREISNEIANKFDVFHQSPQVLLIKSGSCVYDASHSAIRINDLLKELIQ